MATYYISPTGNDTTGDGSIGSPWATLAYAYDNSAAGDTLHLTAGTHVWVTDTFLSRTIEGDDAGTTFIDAGSTAAEVEWFVNNVTINDLTFQNNGGDVWNSGSQAHGIFSGAVAGSTVTFNRCIFTNIRLDIDTASGNIAKGVMLWGNNLNTNLISCIVYDVGCVGTYNQAWLFVGRFNNNQTVTCTGCTFDFSLTGSSKLSGFYFYANSTGNSLTMTNCIINNRSGETCNWYLNTILPITLDYCDYYLMSGTVTAANSITSDPLFVDPANGDFRLRQGSPCLDAGTII